MEVPNVEKYGGPPEPKSQEIKELEIKHDRIIIESVGKDIETLLQQLKEHIESGAYSAIIGDDASGRLPAVMLGGAIQEIYKARGFPPPLMRFMAGTTRLNEKSLDVIAEKFDGMLAQLRRIQDDVRNQHLTNDIKKALLITDFIHTGETVKNFLKVIHEAGWDADIATLSISDTPERAPNIYEQLPNTVIANAGGGGVYGEEDLSGVKKKVGDVFATPYAKVDRERFNKARAYAKEITEKVTKEYLTKEQ